MDSRYCLEAFIFYYVPVWIKLGRISMELWTDVGLVVVDSATKERQRLSYARVYVEINVNSPMPAEVTTNLRGENFVVTVNYEWKPRNCNLCQSLGHSSGKCPKIVENKVLREEDVSKVVSNKEEKLTGVAFGDVVLESFKQVEEGEINSSPTRPIKVKEVCNRDDFSLVIRKK